MRVGETSVAFRSDFFVGALCIASAGLSWSLTGIFLRLAPHLDSWQFLVWRSFGVACAFAILAGARGTGSLPKRFVAMGFPGVAVVLLLSLASITFIVAMKSTTVANALFLSSCSPLLAAAFGYGLLGEKLSLQQAAAIGLGFVGLVVIVGGGMEAGRLAGNVNALLTAVGFAGASVAMRHGPRRDYTPAVLGYGAAVFLFAAAICAARGVSIVDPPLEMLAAFAAGVIAMGVGFALFLRGAPKVPAAAQTVLAQTETIFGPIWVWLAFDEQPAFATLVGGAVILVAVVSMAVSGARAVPAKAAEPR